MTHSSQSFFIGLKPTLLQYELSDIAKCASYFFVIKRRGNPVGLFSQVIGGISSLYMVTVLHSRLLDPITLRGKLALLNC